MGGSALSRELSNQLLSEMLGQNSSDPFLTLLTLSHPSFDTVRLVNNIRDITSRGNVYTAFSFKTKLSAEDGESQRTVELEIDNVSLELIDEIRTATTPINVDLEMVLASNPDQVQVDVLGLKLKTASYNKNSIRASLVFDDFLNTEMTSEKYGPQNFPGLF